VRSLDFTSWQALLSTLLGLSVITLIGSDRSRRIRDAVEASLSDIMVLDLEPVPSKLFIPKQGPSRAMPSKNGKEGERNGAKQSGGRGLGGARHQ
jgi:hypothetical protein